MKQLIAANWKMNLLTRDVINLIDKIETHEDADILICPAFPYLSMASHMLVDKPFLLGGQDCHSETKGAYTGNVSAEMLKDVGCSYVIVGHSERRQHHQESNDLVAKKATAAITAGLTPIVCIGESDSENSSGLTKTVLHRQIKESLPTRSENFVIAYEPIWAIGTGRTPTIDDIAEVHQFIRNELANKMKNPEAIRILYGGSANEKNAGDILACKNVDGVLVGGASLNADTFNQIIKSAAHKD